VTHYRNWNSEISNARRSLLITFLVGIAGGIVGSILFTLVI